MGLIKYCLIAEFTLLQFGCSNKPPEYFASEQSYHHAISLLGNGFPSNSQFQYVRFTYIEDSTFYILAIGQVKDSILYREYMDGVWSTKMAFPKFTGDSVPTMTLQQFENGRAVINAIQNATGKVRSHYDWIKRPINGTELEIKAGDCKSSSAKFCSKIYFSIPEARFKYYFQFNDEGEIVDSAQISSAR